MLTEMARGPGTAAVYAEFLSLEGDGRTPDDIRAYGHALAGLVGLSADRLGVRGLPVSKEQIVPLDIEIGTCACARQPPSLGEPRCAGR